ncbi:MAG: methionyl-tRNA formyltransferase [Alphaproteobacteria bacterium]
MRIIFMGTTDFGLPSLEILLNCTTFKIVAVYTQTPKAKGRRYNVQKTFLHSYAESVGLPVYTPSTLYDVGVQNRFRDHEADVAIVAAYGLMLPKQILDFPKYGCINIHASLLPRWRGAAPIQRAILEGDTKTGITLMKIEEGLDTGDIIDSVEIPINYDTTLKKLHDILAQKAAPLLLKTLLNIDKIKLKPQANEGACYATKIRKEEGFLDWNKDALLLDRKVRALNPSPSTWFFLDDKRIKVIKACFLDKQFGKSGDFFSSTEYKWIVQCKKGALALLSIQKEGGKVMPSEEFLRGNNIKIKVIS